MSSYCTLGFRPFLSDLVSLAGTIWPGGSVGQSAALSRRRSTVRIRSGSLALGLIYGWIPEWPKGADCKSVVTDFGGSNPPPSIETICLMQSNLHNWGLSSAGRASALQAEGHRFEPCRPHLIIAGWSSLVARRAHNPKVVGSNPSPAIHSGVHSGFFVLKNSKNKVVL